MSRVTLVFSAVLLLIAGFFGGILLNRSLPYTFFPAETVVRVSNIEPEEARLTDRPEARSIKDAAKRVTPTVVYIESSVSLAAVHQRSNPSNPDFWQRFVPGQRVSTSGSGVIISEDGFILTNHHVIEGSEGGRVMVELNDRRRISGVVVGSDPATDLAVVKIDEKDIKAAILGNSDRVEVGDWVLAVGNPFRLRSTVTAGIVSALGRDVEVINDRLRIEHFIQTDAAINRGNSGGALVDLDGNVIGINTAIASESGGYEGYGFAIPINMALKIAGDIMEFGQVKRGLLGVQIATVEYDRAKSLGLTFAGGVEVISLVESGTASKAGIRSSDIILAVNNRNVMAANELQALLAMQRPGDKVALTIWREGAKLSVDVELMDAAQIVAEETQRESTMPPQESNSVEFESDFGFKVTEVINESGLSSLILTDVVQGTEAWKKGLRSEDRIVTINGYKATALYELVSTLRTLEKGGVLRLECEKPDGARAFYLLSKDAKK